ncbi:MAG: hypothetical protein HKN60_08100, partial [Rhizobiales bacterium]|nr:hypothetical protein [Hyphomicrobiales bacterium]
MHETAFSQLVWLGDNLASFSPHLAVVLAVFAVALSVTGSRRLAVVVLIAGLPFGGLVARAAMVGEAVGRCTQDVQRITAISMNLLADNQNYGAMIDYISADMPDIVAFQEAVHDWPGKLHRLNKFYPYRAQSPDGATRLFSRHKFDALPFAQAVDTIRRSVGVEINFNGTVVRVVAAHFLKPMTATMHRQRQAQMDEISTLVAQSRKPAIVLGDFNAGPTSFDFLGLIDASRLNTP